MREMSLLLPYGRGGTKPGPMDSFPDLQLSYGSKEFSGPLLNICCKSKLGLHGAEKNTFYLNIVKTNNERGLHNRAASV